MIQRAFSFVARRAGMLAIWLICQLAHLLASAWMLLAILWGSDRAWTIAIGYDQLANATTGGSEDETISSRANRMRKEGRLWGCVLCRVLDWIDPNHCANSEGV